MSIGYLVQTVLDGEVSAEIWSARRILDYLDMEDCFSYDEIHVFEIDTPGQVEELKLYGAWHDFNHPLYLEVCRNDGTVVFDGIGSDH